MNAVYNLGPRMGLAKKWGKETIAGGGLQNKQFNDYVPPAIRWRSSSRRRARPGRRACLKDGSDSVGALGALNRVYLNIGVFSEEWLLHFRAAARRRADLADSARDGQTELGLLARHRDCRRRTWRATSSPARDPHYLKDAPGGAAVSHARTPRPSSAARWCSPSAARAATRASCRRCPPVSISRTRTAPTTSRRGTATGSGPRPTRSRRRCDSWCSATDFLERQLSSRPSCACRSPLLGINACSPLATNAIRGNIWDNFSSESYKTLPSAGSITIRHPITGKEMDYPLPAGGRGYIRPASLVSLWSTAPFLQNNTVGPFE